MSCVRTVVPVTAAVGVSEPPGGFERQPPQDLAAEQSVLGGMLLSKDAIADVVEVVRSEDFYRPAHQVVFDVVLDLYGRGEPADPVTVGAELTSAGKLSAVGGAPYLHTLISSVPTAANAGYYAEIVAERAVQRRAIEAGTRIVQLGYGAAAGSGPGDVEELLDRIQAEAFAVSGVRAAGDVLPVDALVAESLAQLEAIAGAGGLLTGVGTGFAELDELTQGLQPGQMVAVGARPAIGKSALALTIARAAALKQRRATAIFSREMSRGEIMQRLLSAESGTALHTMRAGRMNDDQWQRIMQAAADLDGAPLFLDDTAASVMEIRARARRLKQRYDLRLLVVDYLQLLSGGRRAENRQVEVSEYSRSLKLLAKELDISVLALCQLNRGPELRADKRPTLADIRETGAVENDSDVVVLMHREDVFDRESARAGEADLILAKNRNGPTGSVTVAFAASTVQFVSMYAGEDPDRPRPPSGGLQLLPGGASGNSASGGRG